MCVTSVNHSDVLVVLSRHPATLPDFVKMFLLRSRIYRAWCIRKYVRIRSLFAVLLATVSLVTLVLVYQGTRKHNAAISKFRLQIFRMAQTSGEHVLFKINASNNIAACRLPVLEPFHSSVVQFMKDLGKLHCEGVSYSSFENNVLRVEGEGIVSARYRKIDRTPGDDFDVVLSDPVQVESTGGNPAV